MEFYVIVEVPQGSRNKYELDHESGRIRLDRTLFTATSYPADYGFIENTLGLDGDPLDALVLTQCPTFPGCQIRCRPIGMFQMVDEAGPDDKIVCVPAEDTRQEHLRDILDLSEFYRLEIQHFFEVYKELEPGKAVESGTSWAGRQDAEAEVREALARARRPADSRTS
jgi:inorganic pyrophosphatase